ncbi:hypothetical protein HYPSUDRAFT_205748 [Hypholoma sublateritium FD-334 SS-4]|uniref:Uncharacterized protein n=1 Tax=Hypholoma sublateritium (strain FD-334 SS-4) TaxID=945553 RepID=A0A0D2PCK4_HYPSF|nr:hypothetical protein HYPSUDRAFT_205748 [Hypholoma sublateritium FD-334 SS-4]
MASPLETPDTGTPVDPPLYTPTVRAAMQAIDLKLSDAQEQAVAAAMQALLDAQKKIVTEMIQALLDAQEKKVMEIVRVLGDSQNKREMERIQEFESTHTQLVRFSGQLDGVVKGISENRLQRAALTKAHAAHEAKTAENHARVVSAIEDLQSWVVAEDPKAFARIKARVVMANTKKT